MTARICIVSEAIRTPFDEGVKVFVYNFIKELSKDYEVLGISRSKNLKGEIKEFCIKALPENKLFISSFLRRKIRTFKPDLIYYLPTAHATIYSFLRAKVLKHYGNDSKTILITLQPRKYSVVKKMIIPFIVPDMVFAQTEKTQKVLFGLGCRIRKIQAGVDLEKFKPVSDLTKERLRKKFGFPTNKYIILHVGHINRNRNMQFMEKIQYMDNVQAIIVSGTTYPAEEDLVEKLKNNGVIISTKYIENIEELYQCADCYVFPVFSDSSCIEVPLSVFEAMACNLPVVTTKFGGLPNLVKEQDGFIYADTREEIITNIKRIKQISNPQTRSLVERYSWENVVKSIVANTIAG